MTLNMTALDALSNYQFFLNLMFVDCANKQFVIQKSRFNKLVKDIN